MKKTMIIASLLSFTLLMGVVDSRAASPSAQTQNFARGATLWADVCVRCHNLRSPMDLDDTSWKMTLFHMRIRAGLSGQNTRDIIRFLQASNAKSSAPELEMAATSKSNASSNGKTLYGKTCIACHGADGKGLIPQAPDMTKSDSPLYKSRSILIDHALNGFQSKGSLMAMPPKGGNPAISKKGIEKIIDYMLKTFKTKK